jgi:hypothetical protein
MAKLKRFAEMVGDWQTLHARVEANLAELPDLEPFLERLGTVMEQAREAAKRQGAMRAAKQEASKELRTLAKLANQLVALIRQGLKAHYGVNNEKLAEFGLQPFRGLNRKETDTEEPDSPETSPPVSPGPQPPVK